MSATRLLQRGLESVMVPAPDWFSPIVRPSGRRTQDSGTDDDAFKADTAQRLVSLAGHRSPCPGGSSPRPIPRGPAAVSNDAPTLLRHLHFPLRRVAMCLDCEECFELGVSTCPACGSQTWVALARFLEGGIRSEPAPPGRRPDGADPATEPRVAEVRGENVV